MWYALQSVIISYVAYIYLTEISDQKDILHAIALGVIVAFYTTLILSGALNASLRLIRALRSMLLRTNSRPALRRHQQSNKLIPISGAQSPRPPVLVSQVRLGRGTRDRT